MITRFSIAFLPLLLPFGMAGQGLFNTGPSLGLNTGALVYYGNVEPGNSLSNFSRIRTGYGISLEQGIGNVFSLSASCLLGKLSDSQQSATPKDNLNFQSNLTQGDLSLLFRTEKFFPNSSLLPYLGVGVGYLSFAPFGDLHAANGEKYYYWPDGAIMNEPYTTANLTTAQPLQRSYNFSTKLDSLNKYPHTTLIVPLTLGFEMKITDNFFTVLGATYYMTFTNAIDNVNAGKNDSYLYAFVALKYRFHRSDKTASGPGADSKTYAGVNFEQLDNADTDGDGVKDSKDKCPGTPKGVKVDADGCPLDSDGDGVPDYLDKEPNSKKGAVVDANGVTQTDEMLAKKQADWEAAAVERSEAFNANPSQAVIVDIEKKALENKKENGTGKAIPAEFKGADFNNDGFISSEEINKVIDGFFTGENDFTVERINHLIDFFFEQ